LNPGDVIAVEEPFFKLDSKFGPLRCGNCLKSNKLSLIPSKLACQGSYEVFIIKQVSKEITYHFTAMFCSEECMDIATFSFLPVCDQINIDFTQRVLLQSLSVCGGNFEKLQQLTNDPELSNKTVFDFDFSNPDDPRYNFHMLVSINSLKKSQLKLMKDMDSFKQHPVLQLVKTQEQKSIARNFIIHIRRIRFLNAFSMPGDGSGLFAFSSLLNHSCIPNVSWSIMDNKMVLMVIRPVLVGQQLFITYG
jgi:SET domain